MSIPPDPNPIPPAPNRRAFLRWHLDALKLSQLPEGESKCSICDEAYGMEFPDRRTMPVRVKGTSGCRHIFCFQCLRAWTTTLEQEGRNRCPLDRYLWFDTEPIQFLIPTQIEMFPPRRRVPGLLDIGEEIEPRRPLSPPQFERIRRSPLVPNQPAMFRPWAAHPSFIVQPDHIAFDHLLGGHGALRLSQHQQHGLRMLQWHQQNPHYHAPQVWRRTSGLLHLLIVQQYQSPHGEFQPLVRRLPPAPPPFSAPPTQYQPEEDHGLSAGPPATEPNRVRDQGASIQALQQEPEEEDTGDTDQTNFGYDDSIYETHHGESSEGTPENTWDVE